MHKTIIADKHISLQQLQIGDASEIFRIIDSQREYLGKWLPFVEFTLVQKDTEAFIASLNEVPKEKREYVFSIRFDGIIVGLAGFRDTDRVNKKTEIGYWLSEDYQGKGIVSRAVKAMIEFAFSELDINRIQIRCATENLPSKKIPERHGFKFEGIERDGELLTGAVFTDLDVYSLLRKDYNQK